MKFEVINFLIICKHLNVFLTSMLKNLKLAVIFTIDIKNKVNGNSSLRIIYIIDLDIDILKV